MAAKKPAAKPPVADSTPEPATAVDVTTTQAALSGPVPTAETPTLGVEQTQAKFDADNAQGFVGTVPDAAPNSKYTHPAHGGK